MPIEINGNSASQAPKTGENPNVRVARNEPSPTHQHNGRPSSMDTVSLTDTAGTLHKLDAVIATLPVTDTQRVEGIQKAIASGQFDADPMSVAEKLVDFETALYGTG